ncbi:unnamed protein product, partial [Phaeothamnion confervicola]
MRARLSFLYLLFKEGFSAFLPFRRKNLLFGQCCTLPFAPLYLSAAVSRRGRQRNQRLSPFRRALLPSTPSGRSLTGSFPSTAPLPPLSLLPPVRSPSASSFFLVRCLG